MVKIRLKDGHDATMKMFRTKGNNSVSIDRIDRRNDAIICDLFRRTMQGAIKGFYLLSDKTFKAVHRSTKRADCIQLSYGFFDESGELIPCGDIQFKTAKEISVADLPSGLYAIIE